MTNPSRSAAHRIRPIDDPDIALRAALADSLAHPAAVEVSWQDHTLRLSGAILEGEADELIERVSRIPGIDRIENSLYVIYGGGQPRDSVNRLAYSPESIRGRFPERQRVLVGGISAALMLLSTRFKTLSLRWFGVMAGAIGVIRALANRDIMHLIGSAITPTLRLRRKITVLAPADEVFEFWSTFENYPKFMSYIEKVEVSDRGNLIWTARGPGRLPIQWETVFGHNEPNQRLSWKSIPGSLIQTEGMVRLSSAPEGYTTVDVELSFAPPAGVFGYAAGHLLGFDPKLKIDQDLRVMQTLVERASTQREANAVDDFYL